MEEALLDILAAVLTFVGGTALVPSLAWMSVVPYRRFMAIRELACTREGRFFRVSWSGLAGWLGIRPQVNTLRTVHRQFRPRNRHLGK